MAHGGKIQLTDGSACSPRWRRDGKAIYYFTDSHSAMELPVTSTATILEGGKAIELFKTSTRGTSFWSSTFDAVPDGKEFLAISLGAEEDVPGTLVLNWTAKLKK